MNAPQHPGTRTGTPVGHELAPETAPPNLRAVRQLASRDPAQQLSHRPVQLTHEHTTQTILSSRPPDPPKPPRPPLPRKPRFPGISEGILGPSRPPSRKNPHFYLGPLRTLHSTLRALSWPLTLTQTPPNTHSDPPNHSHTSQPHLSLPHTSAPPLNSPSQPNTTVLQPLPRGPPNTPPLSFPH